MTALAERAHPRRWGRALAGNLGWLVASNGLMVVLSLVYVGIVTRTLGIVDFGRFALITGAAQTLAILMSVESWKVVVQYGLAHEARGDQAAVARLVRAALRVEFASALLGIGCVLLLFALLREPFGLAADLRPYALGYAVAQFLSARSTPTGLLRLKDRFGAAAMADSVQPAVRLVGRPAGVRLLADDTGISRCLCRCGNSGRHGGLGSGLAVVRSRAVARGVRLAPDAGRK